ncbi:hypothetical protein BJ508DRAFT_376135 [Ascobolus immersus RN42]|uniref:Uncharacterized protein n=1 Tax=Ascobolus immersus RN42 TaxID=1160509 RepID=A0A3N4I963_ASCIM|nr:hypothetical protein BJ508DRAFT_376135 [Ascobolus immersus RN42]
MGIFQSRQEDGLAWGYKEGQMHRPRLEYSVDVNPAVTLEVTIDHLRTSNFYDLIYTPSRYVYAAHNALGPELREEFRQWAYLYPGNCEIYPSVAEDLDWDDFEPSTAPIRPRLAKNGSV